VHAELDEDVVDVRRNCLAADRELAGDLLRRPAVCEQPQHLELALREIRGGRRLLLAVGVVLDEPIHAREQLVRIERLHDVVVGAEPQTRDSVERLLPFT
jgi:hypothetical protein